MNPSTSPWPPRGSKPDNNTSLNSRHWHTCANSIAARTDSQHRSMATKMQQGLNTLHESTKAAHMLRQRSSTHRLPASVHGHQGAARLCRHSHTHSQPPQRQHAAAVLLLRHAVPPSLLCPLPRRGAPPAQTVHPLPLLVQLLAVKDLWWVSAPSPSFPTLWGNLHAVRSR